MMAGRATGLLVEGQETSGTNYQIALNFVSVFSL